MQIMKDAEYNALLKLRSFLDATEPVLVKFLYRLWENQQNAITYKEIRESILRGDLSPDLLEEWQQDYSRFVTTIYLPMMEDAIRAGADSIVLKPGHKLIYDFNFDADGVKSWTATRAAQFVTNCTNDQIEAVRTVIRRAMNMTDQMTVDELSHVIRPTVGLTKPQATANLNYYNALRESGVSEKKAQEKAMTYAARQHRQRGYTIARTETAFAYNQGALEGTKQAIEQGLAPATMKKKWCTALDERVCDICGKLDGVTVEIDEEFPLPGNTKIKIAPPAHPNCRCTVLYVEEATDYDEDFPSRIQNE